jgi:hypothetical protein
VNNAKKDHADHGDRPRARPLTVLQPRHQRDEHDLDVRDDRSEAGTDEPD